MRKGALVNRADTEFVQELCEILDGDSDTIKNVVRIGKWSAPSNDNDRKPRPVKVSLRDVDSKRKMMKNLPK